MLRSLTAAFLALAPMSAGAATLGTFTNDYAASTDTTGANAGTYTTVGTLFGPADPVFTDSFDISSLAGEVIEELVLTVRFGGQISIFPGSNDWYMDLYGSDPTTHIDDLSVSLIQAAPGGISTAIITATILSPGDAFATAISNLQVDYGFREETGGFLDAMRIYDAVLTVNGTSAVPLPAPALLLLLALGGLGVARRRGLRIAV